MKKIVKIIILMLIVSILIIENVTPIISFAAKEIIKDDEIINEEHDEEDKNESKILDIEKNKNNNEVKNQITIDSNSEKVDEENKNLIDDKEKNNSEKSEDDNELNSNKNNEEEIIEKDAFDEFKSNNLNILYMSHIQNQDWQEPVPDEKISGTTGENKSIDAVRIKLVNAPQNAKVKYKIYNETEKWNETKYDGEIAGNVEDSKKIYGIKIELENMEAYSIEYRVHIENKGWEEWKTDGALAGSTDNKSKIEAIEIRIISKVSKTIGIKYKSFIELDGWQDKVKNGILSGTTGQNKKMFNISIELENSNFDGKVLYQVHLEDKGWQDWHKDGEIAGSKENNKKIEAIKIKLEEIKGFDVEYRTHVQDLGWQGWVRNGEMSGTTGQNKKIEAIEIKLIKKGDEEDNYKGLLVSYNSHIQDYGWESDFSKSNGETSGTTGKNKKVEAIKIKLENASENAKIIYSVYVEKNGWQDEKINGEQAGTTCQNLKIFAVKMHLVNMDNYSVMYRVHIQDYGWSNWVTDGEVIGKISEKKKIEAIEIKLTKNKNKENSFDKLTVAYNSHVQDYGWEKDFSQSNGEISGTTGKNKKIEALKIKLFKNDEGTGIRYRTYIQNKGWQDWKSNGEEAGTTGENLKIYGIKIELINMEKYSIQYRVHIQDYGWSEWAIDGNTLGKISQEKKIEAIQARLITKTKSYPKSICYTSLVQNRGWEEECLHENGEISGTTGQSLGIYGLKLKLKNYNSNQKVMYRVHVENEGWLSWTTEEFQINAEGKKIEAVQMKLINLDDYTVEYRTHIQDIGWQDWRIDGEISGTTGQSKKIEAIQIRIVPKYKRKYNGIDVSVWNGLINWEYVRRSGIDFGIIRVGYGQHSYQKDDYFEINYRNAKMANIKVGSYLYSYAQSVEDARKEAYNCLGWLSERKFDYPIFYDLEDSSQDWIDRQTITDMAKAFYEILSNAGYQVGIYANKNWFNNKIYVDQLPEDCQIWLAHYTYDENKPSDYSGKYHIWQYTSIGQVMGINTVVDKNLGYRNY